MTNICIAMQTCAMLKKSPMGLDYVVLGQIIYIFGILTFAFCSY